MRASGLPVLAMSLCVMGLSRLLVGCTCLGEWDAVGRRGNLGVPTQKDGKQALARRILMRVGSRMSHSRELLERPLHGRSSEERNACSEQAVMLSSTFVNKKYNEEQAILEEVDFLRRFGTQMSLDGDNQSPVGRKDSTALLRSLLQYLKPVWIIENQLYAMNHLLKLRRKYGVLDDVTLVFMTTFEFGFNQSTQALLSHQYRSSGHQGGKTVVRMSDKDAAYLDALVIHEPLLQERWQSLTQQMHYMPNWSRGRLLKQKQLRERFGGQAASSQDRFAVMSGNQWRDFSTGVQGCQMAGIPVKIVSSEEDAKKACRQADGCTLSRHMEHADFMSMIDTAWVVVVSLLPDRRLNAGGRLVGDALSAGIPVVVSGHPSADPWGGVVEHERNGLIVPAGDHSALAATLNRLSSDRDLYERLLAGARADAVDKYSLEAVGDRLQDIVCNALEHRTMHRTSKTSAEQEAGRNAFNAMIDQDVDPFDDF